LYNTIYNKKKTVILFTITKIYKSQKISINFSSTNSLVAI